MPHFNISEWTQVSSENAVLFNGGAGTVFPSSNGDEYHGSGDGAGDFIGMANANYWQGKNGSLIQWGFGSDANSGGVRDQAGHFYLPHGENFTTGFDSYFVYEFSLYHDDDEAPELTGCVIYGFVEDQTLIEYHQSSSHSPTEIFTSGVAYDGDDVYGPTGTRVRRYYVTANGLMWGEPVDRLGIAFNATYTGDFSKLHVGRMAFTSYDLNWSPAWRANERINQQRAVAKFL